MQPIAGQAFEVRELSPGKRYWFVPAKTDYDFIGVVLDSEKSIVSLPMELDKDAGERLGSFDSVAFFDANEDGLADVVAVVTVKVNEGSPKHKMLRLLQGKEGTFGRDNPEDRALSAELGEQMTMAQIRKRLRLPLLRKATVSCRSLTLPIAVSDDGLLAYSPGDNPPLFSLASGEAPAWMTPRLQEAIGRISYPSCAWQHDEDMPHGGHPVCTNPIQELNDVLAGVQDGPSFDDTEAQIAGGVSLRGSKLRLVFGAPGLKPGHVQLPAECPLQGDERVLGTIASDEVLAVFLGPDGTDVPSLYTEPEEAKDCLESGGTCVQDIVEVPSDFPRVQMVTIRGSR